VEAADTSLRYDLTGKRDLYARAAVPQVGGQSIRVAGMLP